MAKRATVNWAIVGLGGIVRKRVASAILQQPDSSLYACVTRDPRGRNADLESWSPIQVYRNVDRMLADPNVADSRGPRTATSRSSTISPAPSSKTARRNSPVPTA